MAVTHDMIASKLAINRTTVTKALKSDPSIKKGTRKKVQEMATLMGYDFKQSQQNRREGKRYFINEHVRFEVLPEDSDQVIVTSLGILTNLSSTGALVQITENINVCIPLIPFRVRIVFLDDTQTHKLPLSRVVRINYLRKMELATKFSIQDQLGADLLVELENIAFKKVEKKMGRPRKGKLNS